MDLFLDSLQAHCLAVKSIEPLAGKIRAVSETIIDALKNGNKVLVFGNGGSAADSQHIAAELVGRFKLERRGLPAMALSTDTSILTALGNDYGFDYVFARQVEAHGRKGDIAIGISTSGNSPNVIRAIEAAREMGCTTIGLLGGGGGALKDLVEVPIIVPSADTPRIQECHILLAHILCDMVERAFALE